jgi:hypothetical protein
MGAERNRPAFDNQMGLESDEPCPNNETVNANGRATRTLECIRIFLSLVLVFSVQSILGIRKI